MIKLKKLLRDLPVEVKGSKDIEISGICSNSKLVAPGCLFIAQPGNADDGSKYIGEAIEAGAVAIATDMYNPFFKGIVQLIYPNIRALEPLLADRYYDAPSKELFLVGITGTNGKTTSSYLIKHLLDALNMPSGLIGTIDYIVGETRYRASLTTPDAITNQRLLREMVHQGCRAAVMEVSSHGLNQKRVEGLLYDVAIFTNLTQDHLDYHKTMEEYATAKALLFKSLTREKSGRAPCALINGDSPAADRMVAECQAQVTRYGIDKPADIRATHLSASVEGTHFQVTYEGHSAPFFVPFVGRHNVYNCLTAIGVGLCLGLPLTQLATILATAPAVAGRLEMVPNQLGLHVFVDFAHSDDGLINVLSTLKPLCKGRLLVVFGAGGDRDKAKRPKMAAACEAGADYCIVTSDNPRSEDPEAIIRDICSGFRFSNHMMEVDRRTAIDKALSLAHPGDFILIAGRGHETVQKFHGTAIDFSDREVTAALCRAREEIAVS